MLPQMTFDWTAALRRSRQSIGAMAEGRRAVERAAWKRFPFGDRIYRYGGTALRDNWNRLHLGDREPYPCAEWLDALVVANPALQAHVGNPDDLLILLEDAWRAYHAGDFAVAVERGTAAGPLGMVVATRAAAVYAAYLENDAARRLEILCETVESSNALVQLAPLWANAWYVHGLALGRYSQHVSTVRTLTRGRRTGAQVRYSLQRALQLAPLHSYAQAGLGIYHAEVIGKLGGVMATLSCGARRERVIEHFEEARRLHPRSALLLAEYARSLTRAFGDEKAEVAHQLFEEAVACQPADALERLGLEIALAALE